MEIIWKVFNLCIGLLFFELCNGLPINLEYTAEESHTQLLTGLVAVLLTICSVVALAGCLCCQRRNGFKEFRDSPVVASQSSILDHGHINPVANGEFTIFTPLSPPHQNNNVFLANQQIIIRTPEDYSYGDVDVSSWFNGTEKDFPRIKLKYIREIGKGWFGRVVEGAAQDIDNEQKWTPVAVRILEATASSRERVVFLHDASIYRCGKHPNILQLVGRCLDTVPLLLLQEFCPQGDLKKYLRENQSNPENLLSTEYPLIWCCQLTSALKHLHENKLIHPDLASRNCYLTTNLTLKLGDYGLGVYNYPEDYYQGTAGVPVRWLSPESIQYTQTTIQPKPITQETNIWSLAVTMWEICECGKQPYSNLTDDDVITNVLGGNNVRLGRPKYSVLYTDYIFRLMELCWTSSESRPSVSQIDLMLKDLLQVHKNTTQQQQQQQIPEDFDKRWESLKPNNNNNNNNNNQIDCFDNDNTEQKPNKQLSPSLNNLHGSLDNLLETNPMESWLENVATKTGDLTFVKGLSDAIQDLDNTLAQENISISSDSSQTTNQIKSKIEFHLGPLQSKSFNQLQKQHDSFTDSILMQRNSSGSETEEENWKTKIERGAYSEKVRQKSRSVADLMILTHIDYSESETETPLPSLDYRINNYKNFRQKNNNLDVSLIFGSEGNLLNVQNTFQDELKKLQEERKDSLLFVPDKRSQISCLESSCNNTQINVPTTTTTPTIKTTPNREESPSKRLLEELNSTSEIKPSNQVYNVFNVTISNISPLHTKLKEIINIDNDSKCQVPKLSDIIINNNSNIVNLLANNNLQENTTKYNGFYEDYTLKIDDSDDDKEHIRLTVPKLVDIIQNNDELMDYIIANYDENSLSEGHSTEESKQSSKENSSELSGKFYEENNNKDFPLVDEENEEWLSVEIEDLMENQGSRVLLLFSEENNNKTDTLKGQIVSITQKFLECEVQNYDQHTVYLKNLKDHNQKSHLDESSERAKAFKEVEIVKPIEDSKLKTEQFLEYEIESYQIQKEKAIIEVLPNDDFDNTKSFDSIIKSQDREKAKDDEICQIEKLENISNTITDYENRIEIMEKLNCDNNKTEPKEILDEILEKCLEIIKEKEKLNEKVDFDLSENQDETIPNSLTHSVVFSSTPFGKRSIQEPDCYSSLNLFVNDQDETTEINDNDKNLYSLETWDKYLGKVLENQDQDGLFDSFSSEPQSLLFIDNENSEKKLNGENLNKTFTIESTPIKVENNDKNNDTFILQNTNEINDNERNEENDNGGSGVWETNSGWFLHPQSINEDVTGEITVVENVKTDSYVGFNVDDEVMAAIRNELLTKLPQAQGISSEKIHDEEELDLLEKNEVFLKYNVYNTPLSPIPEESLLEDDQTKQQDDEDSDWSEPCDNGKADDEMIQDTESQTLESPRRHHRHTPSQDSCCSNDTLFNLEELANNEHEEATTLNKKDDPNPNEDHNNVISKISEEPTEQFNESNKGSDGSGGGGGVLVVVNNSDDINNTYITDFLNSERETSSVEIKLEESDNTESLLPFINTNHVAPLPSPEDKPWKQLPASLLSYDKIIPQNKLLPQNDDNCDSITTTQQIVPESQSSTESLYDNVPNNDNNDDDDDNNDKINDYDGDLTDINDIYNEADYVNIVNMENSKNSSSDDRKSPDYVNSLIIDDDHDIYGVLTDIRFNGPGDNQMMTTSFSESNDLNDEQDWDSGSDTRSSSSGEFIWKEGEHEESLKALRAAPQDVDDIKPMEEIQEEITSESDDDSEDDEEGESPEFVPSAWDKYATPTKSALRSPEKTLEKTEKKKSKGVWFKKQKYHCVYEYPREPESPLMNTFDLWAPRQDYNTFADWEFDVTDAFNPINEASSDDDFTYSYPKSKRNLNLYQLSNVDFSSSSGLDDEFFISSSAKPFDMMGGLSSQFFPGGKHWSNILKTKDNITPDSGVEDITPSDYIAPLHTVQSLKTLALNVVKKKNNKKVEESTTMGGLRHTRNQLKLDLPPSPSAFTSSKIFNIETTLDPVINREKPAFTTFGKSRFLVQHVDTPPDDDDTTPMKSKNVSFEALPYKPLQKQVYIKDFDIMDKNKGKVEIVRGEASLLDSADEDSGIESSTLERKMTTVE